MPDIGVIGKEIHHRVAALVVVSDQSDHMCYPVLFVCAEPTHAHLAAEAWLNMRPTQPEVQAAPANELGFEPPENTQITKSLKFVLHFVSVGFMTFKSIAICHK
ncbi:hypothetical protein MYU51_005591 [Penicillium brevicompactum]